MKTQYYKQDEIRQDAIEKLQDLCEDSVYGCDLHHELFNTDYYIIGTWKAKEWLKDFTFDAIEAIREYEQDNFGEVNTDFSNAEKVVNMYVYIVGEEVLRESDYLQNETWDRLLTKEDIKTIINELKELN